MASKIEIELTSKVGEDYWTWRAAGARNPKGTLPSSLLYADARVGDVVKAEVAYAVDGIEVLSVARPVREKRKANVIELVGPPAEVKKQEAKPRRERRERAKQAGHLEKAKASSKNRPAQKERSLERERQPRARTKLETQAKPVSRRAESKRLRPKDTQRKAVIESVLPEHRPIAEQLVRGGMPAVREAIVAQNEREKAAGLPLTPMDAALKIAESILPKVRVATWLDRAEAALASANDISLRDLRATVTAVDKTAKDPRVLELSGQLNEILKKRVSEETEKWLAEIAASLEQSRLVRALRLSFRIPDPTAKLTPELTEQLVEAVNREMTPDTTAERWMVLIDAVANSPIRRLVKPQGLPENAPPELIELAKETAGRIPALAELVGISVPPPPKPEILAKIPRTSRRSQRRKEGSDGNVDTQSAAIADSDPVRSADGSPDID
jgi:hypothetical protein